LYGVDVDMPNVNRILDKAAELEQFTGMKREKWFYPKKRKWDHEYPGNEYTRTSIKDGACIFLNRNSRGCSLHSFALEEGLDYHELKPFFCAIFPLTFYEGILLTPEEIDSKSLVCLGDGPTLYQGARNALKYYFGDEMISELDAIEIEFDNPTRKSA
jgi:hypothetical protein